MYTDIAMGFNNEICSILVLSGETKIGDLKNSKTTPDFIFDNVYKLYKKLNKL